MKPSAGRGGSYLVNMISRRHRFHFRCLFSCYLQKVKALLNILTILNLAQCHFINKHFFQTEIISRNSQVWLRAPDKARDMSSPETNNTVGIFLYCVTYNSGVTGLLCGWGALCDDTGSHVLSSKLGNKAPKLGAPRQGNARSAFPEARVIDKVIHRFEKKTVQWWLHV